MGEFTLTAAGGWASTTNGCGVATQREFPTNDVDLVLRAFDPLVDEHLLQWTVWMPDDWDAGAIQFKAAWTAFGGTPGQYVVWYLNGRAYADSDAIDQTLGAGPAVSIDVLSATGRIHYSPVSGNLVLQGGPVAGEAVQLCLGRGLTVSDLAAAAQLIAIKVYYGTT